MGNEFAIVEIGSGAVKALLHKDGATKRWRHATAMLSEINADGALSVSGSARIAEVLSDVHQAIGPIDDITVVATEALRQTAAADVQTLVSEIMGRRLKVLGGTREAELGYRAAMAVSGNVATKPSVTIDLGFASTEFATVGGDGRMHTMSIPIGAGTITNNYLHSDPPDPAELSAALSVIELHVDDLKREQPELATAIGQGRAEIIGLGVTRFIAEVELGKNNGDEIAGYVLEYVGVEEVFRALATETTADRAANPGLWPQHVDWIVGAMCILVEFMRQFAVPSIRISLADVIDGLMAEKLGPQS